MSTDSDTDSSEVVVPEDEENCVNDKLDITQEQADANLAAAGSEVMEEKDKISMEEHYI